MKTKIFALKQEKFLNLFFIASSKKKAIKAAKAIMKIRKSDKENFKLKLTSIKKIKSYEDEISFYKRDVVVFSKEKHVNSFSELKNKIIVVR